ncbi:hypothetical protein B0H10DRAFT_2113546, partial [Mycena sp. CBHHK59/15]
MQDEVEMKHDLATYICQWYSYTWRLSESPDPRDADPDRYTMLAAIVEEEPVRAFNFRLKMGLCRDIEKERRRARIPQSLESPSSWAARVPPARKRIVLMNDEIGDINRLQGDTFPEPPTTVFEHRDILALTGALFFVWYIISFF